MKQMTIQCGQGGVVEAHMHSPHSRIIWPGLPAVLLCLNLLLTGCSSANLQAKNLPAFTIATSTPPASRTLTSVSQADNLLYPVTLPDAHAGALTTIRMLDQTRGWALTQHAILRTRDGGLHWKDVTPASAQLNAQARGDFMDGPYAWIADTLSNGNLFLLRTSDGGQNWQNITIPDPQSTIADMPHFLTPMEGWLEVITHGASGPESESADILHTLDGGQNWSKIAGTGRFNISGLPRSESVV